MNATGCGRPTARGSGFLDHPAIDLLSGRPIHFLTDRHPALAHDEAKAAELWEALAAIEAPGGNRGVGVSSRPRDDYEGDDVPQASAAATVPAAVPRWATVEITFSGPSHGNPFSDVDLAARFTLDGVDGVEAVAGGFYDGDGRWIIRFLPGTQGRWEFTTSSNARSLNAVTGHFQVTDQVDGEHGPVRVDGYHFGHAGGTRHTPLGTTAYAWIHQPAEVRAATLRTLEGSPFSKVRMTVFPKVYLHNTNEPELYPFAGTPPPLLRVPPPGPGRHTGTFRIALPWREFMALRVVAVHGQDETQ
ncbi:DUF5060 domain-containing protein [Streptomyces mirabilis]|uniref:DUF5060 domain-containing protein n=1 Tax=Streptomyces mirabilis TaxID=68239 RepID=UPI003658DEDE